MSLFWSLKSKNPEIGGRAYWGSKSGSIFLNNIYQCSGSFGEFIAQLTRIMFHEYLHLFFKFELGMYQNSCKTIIDPLAVILVDEMAQDQVFVERIVSDFMDISAAREKESLVRVA